MKRQGTAPLYCHVRFATKTVGPVKLPPFAYTCTEVGFNSLTYVAVLAADSAESAAEQVKKYWKDATVFRIVRNQMFMYEDYTTKTYRLGFVDHAPHAKPPKHWRWFGWFRRSNKDEE